VNWPRFLIAVVIASLTITSARAQNSKAVSIEPGELTRRPDLVGREVVLDDRVGLFQYHKETGFDQLFLKRAPDVTFELPTNLRSPHRPQAAAAKVRGVLRREGDRWWVDVVEVVYLPSDLDRLNRAVALLAASDVSTRTSWARWAETRGREFGDDVLLARAREVEGEAIRFESDRPPSRDQASFWLALADRARSHKVAEPEPSAQAHRGLRAALGAAKAVDELKDLRKRVEEFFPDAPGTRHAATDLTKWEKTYLNAPAAAYRLAPSDARAALDHRLWADVTQQFLERRAVEDPKALITLAEEAGRLLPDRPELAGRFLEKGVTVASSDVGSLRQSEVDTLAKIYRVTLHQPEKAQALYRAWLDEQKNRRLSPRDAEGRIALAQQYETLLDDRTTSLSLLRDAWKIDPESREVADAFRRQGFRKVNNEWVEPSKGNAGATSVEGSESAPADPKPSRARSDSLRNATPEQVVSRMGGKPNKKVLVASQGQVIEQWIYIDPRQTRYVNILRRPGDPQPHVISYYSLPRTASDTAASP
jgi:tetratricopeptide (TPR) repeat protein